MRNPSFARRVGSAGCALLGGLLWLAASAGGQETAHPSTANGDGGTAVIRRAVLLAPVAITPDPAPESGLPQAGEGQRDGTEQGTPAGQPPPKAKEGQDRLKELLELPLEQLAEQPVRVPVPAAAVPPGLAAAAAAAPTSAVNPFVPGPVVTAASRREEKSSAAPAGVVVIDRREIVLRGYSTLVDVLRDLPGMETIEYFHEWGTQVPIRGISGNNKFVVLVNGVRVNPPGGENFPLFNDFSVRFAERIEVIYGSGTVLYGQDAISAIINVVTRSPESVGAGGEGGAAEGADQLASKAGVGGATGGSKLMVQMGADGGVDLQRDTWGWFGGVLDPANHVTYTGYVQYHDSNLSPLNEEFPAYWQNYITQQDAPARTNSNGVVPHREDFGLNLFGRVEGYGSSLQVWHRDAARNSAEGYSPALAFVPEAIWEDRTTVVEGMNTQHLTDKVTLESRLTYSRYEVDPISRYVEPDPTNPNQWFLNDYKYAIGWQGRGEETLRIELPDRISLLTGVDVFYADIIPKSTIPGGFNPAGGSPVAQGGTLEYTVLPVDPHLEPAGMLEVINRVTESKYWDYSPFVEVQWQLLDRLRLIGGTRVTWDDRFPEVPITPRAAVVNNLTDRITTKYVYTQGFVAPAPYFANAVYDRLDILARPNPNLGPESSQEHDVILTYARNNFSLTLNPYYGTQTGIVIVSDQETPLNIVDQLVSVPASPSGPAGTRTVVETVNGGMSERYGADIYGKGTFGRISPWFSYSYVDYRQTTAGVTTGLPGISRHNGRLGVTWTATPRLFITPSLVIRSTPENVNPDALAAELQTPYEINLFVLYKYTDYLDLFLNLRNITDNHYALGGFAGTAIPQEPFHGVFGLQLRY